MTILLLRGDNMQMLEKSNKTLEKQIEEINEILNQLKNNQIEEKELLNKKYNICIKKLEKLQEYNKIADMTNQLFEKGLLGIEIAIKEISKVLSA